MSVAERTEQLIELRCPIGPRALLAKVVSQGDFHQVIYNHDSPLSPASMPILELACRDCARMARHSDPSVRRVLHHFNMFGQLVESRVQRDPQPDQD